MASYTDEYDSALLQVPWLAKTDASSRPYLIKYARHPTKPGYIVLITDLTKVYFEPLVGIRLLARQREVQEKYGESQRVKDAGGISLDIGGEEAVHEVLEGLDDLMGSELEEADLAVSAGDLYDLDAVLKSPTSNWVFHMTEIRYGCLEIITRHILHPLALSVTSSKRPSSSTHEQIVEVVSSNVVLSAINSHSAHRSKKIAQASKEEREDGGVRPGHSRLVRRRDADHSKSEAVTPGSEASSSKRERTSTKSPSPTLRDTTPSKARSKRCDSPSATPDEDEMMPEEADPELPSSPPRRRSISPVKSTARGKRKQVKDGDKDEDKDMASDPAEEEEEKAVSPDPPLPPPSQKSQKEKEEEEEEELAKKRDEMKRKMGAGGGGRLVRRRFGR